MSIFHFETFFGSVQLLCIGEWSVQSFRPSVLAGASVKRMDEIGYFDVGSQVILVLPKGLQLLPKEGARVFVGDPMARCEDLEKMFLWHHGMWTSLAAICCGTTAQERNQWRKSRSLSQGRSPALNTWQLLVVSQFFGFLWARLTTIEIIEIVSLLSYCYLIHDHQACSLLLWLPKKLRQRSESKLKATEKKACL